MNEERPLKMLALIAVGAVLLSCAGVYVATSRWTSGASASVGAPTGVGGEVETVRVLQEQVQRDVEERAQRERTLAEARASELLADLAETRTAVEAAQQALTQWNEQVPALLTSEQGKRVAADPERVRTFHAISSRLGRPSESQVGALAQRVELLERQLEQVRSSDAATLSEDSESAYAKQLQEDQAEALGVQRELEEDLDAVKALVAKSATASPAPRSLAAALEELELEMAARRAEVIAAERLRVDTQQTELDKQMEGRKYEEIRVAQRQRREVELEDERQREETAAAIAAQKSKEEDQRRRAASDTVQAVYAPLLQKGKTKPYNNNPGGPGTMTWNSTGRLEAEHVSLSDVKRTNALASFEDFVRLLTSSANDRGSWPPASSDASTTEYRRRFEEFKELAPIWIEMGLLRP